MIYRHIFIYIVYSYFLYIINIGIYKKADVSIFIYICVYYKDMKTAQARASVETLKEVHNDRALKTKAEKERRIRYSCRRIRYCYRRIRYSSGG